MSHTDPGEQDRSRSRKRIAPPSDSGQIGLDDLLAGTDPVVRAAMGEAVRADIDRENEWASGLVSAAGAVLGAPAPEQPRIPSKGLERKERELANHESGHEDRLGYIREKLRELYAERKTTYLLTHPSERHKMAPMYVTADDAAKILEAAGNLGYLDDDERRNWFGAIFRSKGWRWVEPKLVPSLRPEMNGRMQRTWAWEPAP